VEGRRRVIDNYIEKRIVRNMLEALAIIALYLFARITLARL
jgi:succinate dehydrogenase hydrophobic anchor subunit